MSRRELTLREAFEFMRHASPWIFAAGILTAVTLRIAVGGWHWTQLLAPLVVVAISPVVEWLIHVHVLHARPRRLAGVRMDSLLARKHRAHHAEPTAIPLVFVPWQVELWLFPVITAVCWFAFPSRAFGLSVLVCVAVFGAVYEWTHYLLHSTYRPRSALYRRIWRHHRLHHFKSEHYWFTVTSAGTADRWFGTDPDPSTVPTSPTVRRLHGLDPEAELDPRAVTTSGVGSAD